MQYIEREGHIYRVWTTKNGTTVEQIINRYVVSITTDKQQIASDGLDVATVTASVYDYLGQPVAGVPVPIMLDGEQIGTDSVEIVAEADAVMQIKSNLSDARNGEVVIYAVTNGTI